MSARSSGVIPGKDSRMVRQGYGKEVVMMIVENDDKLLAAEKT